ncbi:hypothetical protein BCY91_12270 [Pelobium manganitolerans]|uniref:Glycosyltransferase subfamily 4-like N-terminal domain-containing protein n=1 Tax=Pelobium manganitolerans TaxID=1842495 RepID=A0A419S1Q3_9SPHI|nr:hypothetical protein [Pelobium manganitolerans]RKD12418.1 hypothetical protein BCY91_12270 [Pelobium manganitolerans]
MLKEADALYRAGYEVHIVATSYQAFLKKSDEIIINSHPEWYIHTKYWGQNSRGMGYEGYLYGLLKAINRAFAFRSFYPVLLNRHFHWQLKQAIAVEADLYIAHSAASIAVAAKAAEAHQSLFAFDAEDFHSGEDLSAEILAWVNEVQQQYLRKAVYLTVASPLIAEAYQHDLGRKDIVSILNVFPKNDETFRTKKQSEALKLFWFSQNIGKGRGLEWVLEALQGKSSGEVELHLLGNLRSAEALYFEKLISKYQLAKGMVCFHEALPEHELLNLAKTFDVGLSLEIGKPLNRELCLNNKIFVYLQAGLGIIATDTRAQNAFFEDKKDGVAILSLAQPEQLGSILLQLIAEPEKVEAMRSFNHELAKRTYNWEKEQVKLINIVAKCLQEKSLS